ncbi:MAG: polysaccharide pyruvyl transferase family protein [Planctomycetes bacterium]|nr:polysaccharide pyruvyl transferase family protein [Planctomycetota bacterium]
MSHAPRICLLGAHHKTGNLGVSALAEGTLQGIFDCAEDAEVSILAGLKAPGEHIFRHRGRRITVPILNISFSKRIFGANHILMLTFKAVLLRLVGRRGLRKRLSAKSPVLAALADADVVADISGGDSFTDTYGWRRMLLQSLLKLMALAGADNVVLLPQTIGPFNGRLAKAAARALLRRTAVVYSRDREGLDEIRRLAGRCDDGFVRFAPDVALLVRPVPPDGVEEAEWAVPVEKFGLVVGVNVSGLLLSGGYTKRNQFGLRSDYKSVVVAVVRRLLEEPGVRVLLVPHVFTTPGELENDPDACEAVRNCLPEDERARVFVVRGLFGPAEIKHVIGKCDFFVGSRMHACIAALSQGVPAVGIAYSRKFRGVFNTLGVEACVTDPRIMSEEEIVSAVADAFRRREEIREVLAESVPAAKAAVRKAFRDIVPGAGGQL